MQFQGARAGVSEREGDVNDSSFWHFKFFSNYPYYRLGRVRAFPCMGKSRGASLNPVPEILIKQDWEPEAEF